jgi:CubicO group peptidase (beta-lactamase class C family)
VKPTPVSAEAARAAAPYLDSWLGFRQRLLRVPGVQAAMAVDGELVLSTAYGFADVEAQVPMTPDHLFRVASHSKMFTATAVLQLVESGQLRLDDRVASHLPWLDDSAIAGRTLRDLLSHGSGIIRDGLDADHWQLSQPFLDHEGLRRVALDQASVLDANERFKYSNITFSLLGEVIAAVSGMPYNEYVARHVVDRIGLTDSFPELVPERAADYATGYSALGYAEHRLPIDHVDTSAMSAATGFTSTARDLVQFVSAHRLGDQRLLTDDSKRRMQHAEWPTGEKGHSYGLGVDIQEIDDHRTIGHGGGYPGHITGTRVDPRSGVAISVLTNAIDGPARGLVAGVLALIGIAAGDPGEGEQVDVTAEKFCGRFANLWGVTDVVRLGDRLVAISPESEAPAEDVLTLSVAGDDRLIVNTDNGFGGPGEAMVYSFDGSSVASVQGPGGTTSWPIERFAAMLDGRKRITAGDLSSGPAGRS